MKKTIVAALTVATVAGSLVTATPSAKAGDGVGAGIAAGLIGGAIVGGAIASSPYYYGPGYGYYGPGPYYAGAYGPCGWQRQRFWDGYGWRVRSVRVCD
jgi:uncharacterized membrane protein YeaQ/YmgE (transglycosylase-associated protein family)